MVCLRPVFDLFVSDSKPLVNSIDHNSINSNSMPVSSVSNSNSVSLTSSGNPSVPSAPSPHSNSTGPTVPLGPTSASTGINSIQNNSSRSDMPIVLNGPHSAGSHFILKVRSRLHSDTLLWICMCGSQTLAGKCPSYLFNTFHTANETFSFWAWRRQRPQTRNSCSRPVLSFLRSVCWSNCQYLIIRGFPFKGNNSWTHLHNFQRVESKKTVSNWQSFTPQVQDSDGQSDSKHIDEESSDYLPSNSRENQSEDDRESTDDGLHLFTDHQVHLSTSCQWLCLLCMTSGVFWGFFPIEIISIAKLLIIVHFLS